ncbi:mitochondrial phosphate carrier protein [Hypoxylon texense]
MKATAIWIVAIAALDISQNGTASNTSIDSTPPGIVNGTISKDFRLQCDISSMGLVRSEQRPIVYYLRGVCAGAYG